MVVKNNMSAVNTLNTLNTNHLALSKSLQKVSSGMRINGAADDASGYAISERMRVQIRSLEQDNRNVQNGISMMKVAEGAVQSTVNILKTLKEKVINAANDTNTDSDRQNIQKELDQSIDQINDNANVTYNGKYLIDGSHNSQVVHDECRNPNGVRVTNSWSDLDRGTYTHLTNSSFDKSTQWNTKLTDLKNRNGESLNIKSDDTVTISVVQEGKTYTMSFQVGTNHLYEALIYNTYNQNHGLGLVGVKRGSEVIDHPPFWTGELLSSAGNGWTPYDPAYIGHDAAGNNVYTPDGEPALTMLSGGQGLTYQVSGFTVSITDVDGNINKSANAVLDAWTETIRAQAESQDNSIVLQTGTKANQAIKVGFTDMRARALGLQGSDGTTLNVCSQINANAAINVLDNAVQKALDEQTKIGATISRLEYTSANLTTASENVTASESTIRDADMAKEMTEYTKNNVLLQAAQSMLAQANQNSSSVLSLLQ
ncbi:MAG: flagellin [Schwartzia sp.]|nr:flagellin [Schwartzia sp. (in: firmicutes)]